VGLERTYGCACSGRLQSWKVASGLEKNCEHQLISDFITLRNQTFVL
jgi:hypothetical protein